MLVLVANCNRSQFAGENDNYGAGPRGDLAARVVL
jgi:hypothetical protein